LEEIVVCKACSINPMEMNADHKLSRNPSRLKSLVFVATPTKLHANRVYRFFDVEDSSNLTTFWCNLLQLHDNSNLPYNLTSVAWTAPYWDNQQQLPGPQLGHLESYWEPNLVLMKSVLDSPTKLKLINCFYDPDNFLNFCENHPLLEVLKLVELDLGWEICNKSRTVWNSDSWKNLSRLRILSVEAALIRNTN